MTDWNPAQYRRFADERRRPFVDLLDLVQVPPGGLGIPRSTSDVDPAS